jgi:putative redox protein
MVTATIGLDRYKTEIISSGHTVISDEAVDSGGKDLGPSPPEFILIALASCTAMTLRMYADRKNLPVNKVTVDVDIEKSGNLTLFNRTIFIEGTLSEDQKKRMLQIADSCPVHKTLSNPIEIKTHLAE